MLSLVAAAGEGMEQFSCSYNLYPCSDTCLKQRKGRERGHLSPVHVAIWPMKASSLILKFSCWLTLTLTLINRVSSAVLPRWDAGPNFLSGTARKGEGLLPSHMEAIRLRGEGIFPMPHHYTTDEGGKAGQALLILCPQGWLTCATVYRVNSTVMPGGHEGSILLSTAAGEGLGQVPHLLQVVRGSGRHLPLITWKVQHALLFSGHQDQLTHVPENRVSCIVLPRWSVGPSLLNVSSSEPTISRRGHWIPLLKELVTGSCQKPDVSFSYWIQVLWRTGIISKHKAIFPIPCFVFKTALYIYPFPKQLNFN